MYAHDKNKEFARFLKQKADGSEIEEQCDHSSDYIEAKEQKFIRVFDTDRMIDITEENGKSSNLYKNHKRLLTQLGETEGYLPLVELPESIFDGLESLTNRFPNFQPVIDFYKQEFALARLTKNPVFSAQPLLILSPPGCGKTTFCHELAKLVGTHFEFISMSSMTAGFVLSGNSSKWSEGGTGKVAQAYAIGHCANPLFVTDEVDKVGGDNRYAPLGSLYILLEKVTAQKFMDESLEMAIDASHAVWIATANYRERIPEPIFSRFTIIEISQPSNDQMSLVLNSIYTKIRENHRWGNLFHEVLSQHVVDNLVNSGLEPRLLQKTLISACGQAVLRIGSDFDSLKDKLEISIDDLNITQSLEKNSVSLPSRNNSTKNMLYEPEVVIMPIINAPISDSQNPEETMTLWSVYEVQDTKAHHLAGYIPTRKTGRVTSAIRKFDKVSMRLITSSGRAYKLLGPPALNGETKHIWKEWKQEYDIEDDIDVTHQYLTNH